MKKNNQNYLDLITSIDILNTINGGSAEPQVQLTHFDDYREIRVHIPGIAQEAIRVEVHNNNLSIYYLMLVESGDAQLEVPRMVYNRNVPYYVDIGKINARTDEHAVVVTLPFNRLANGFHKEIKIKQG